MRKSRRFLIVLFAAMAGCETAANLAFAASSPNYRITKIADSSNGFTVTGDAAVSDMGTVVFSAEMPNSAEAVFLSDGTTLVNAFQQGTNLPSRFTFTGTQRVNSQNQITVHGKSSADWIWLWSGGTVSGLYNTYTTGNPSHDINFIYSDPAISNSGIVVFSGETRAVGDGLIQGDIHGTNPFLRVPYSAPPYFSGIYAPTVANDGTVAFRGALYSGGSGVFMQPANGGIVTIAQASDPTATSCMKINNRDEVLYETKSSGFASLYLYHNGASTELVDSGGYFTSMTADINDLDEYAFQGWGGSTTGIYTGPDRSHDCLIASGDLLLGERVNGLRFYYINMCIVYKKFPGRLVLGGGKLFGSNE